MKIPRTALAWAMVAELNGIEATAQIMKRHPAVNVAKNTVKDHVRVILEKLGVDYLLVSSTAPNSAQRGKLFRYELSVKSKRGGLKFELEDAPKGMKISDAGEITWPVPSDIASAPVNVIVSVEDSTGQQRYHTFQLRLD
mgnify:CR=1 FL=1